MRKWKLGCIGAVVGVLGLLIWGFFSLKIYVPRVRVVHIETPGGPVPVCVTFLDKTSAYIRVGHNNAVDSLRLETGPGRDLVVRNVDWSPLGFEIEFPKARTTLWMKPVSDPQGDSILEGTLVARGREKMEEELRVVSAAVSNLNWFDPRSPEESTQQAAHFDGRWRLEPKSSGDVAMIEIWSYTQKNTMISLADGVLLSFSTAHRNFAGCVTGNRIRLASFENAYPALIDATIQEDGTLVGDLWVGGRLHEPFIGVRE